MKHSRDLIVFPVLACGISWLMWSPYFAATWFPSSWHTHPFFHYTGATGPLLAAWLTPKFREPRTPMSFAYMLKGTGQHWIPWCAALTLPFLVLAGSCLLLFLSGASVALTGLGHTTELPDVSVASTVVLQVLVVGLGEEAGWRGFALPRLQASWNALTASLLLTIGWALWHWPLFCYPHSGFYTMTVGTTAGWLFSLALGSIMLTAFYNSSGGSVGVCALFHGAMDIVFTAPFADERLPMYNSILITLAGFATLLLFRPRNLAPYPRQQV